MNSYKENFIKEIVDEINIKIQDDAKLKKVRVLEVDSILNHDILKQIAGKEFYMTFYFEELGVVVIDWNGLATKLNKGEYEFI